MINPISSIPAAGQLPRDVPASTNQSVGERLLKQPEGDVSEMQEVFREFVGQTFFGQMMASMHKTHDKAAYFDGGRGEEIFQQQLDQVYVEELTESSAGKIADPMFELFRMRQS